MCLCMIDKRYKPSKVIREAWKCFRRDSSNNLFSYWRRESPALEQNKWITANFCKIDMGDPPWPDTVLAREDWIEKNRLNQLPQYTGGFHAFANFETATQYAVRVHRVFLRGIRLIGREYNASTASKPLGPVYVAEEMFIPSV